LVQLKTDILNEAIIGITSSTSEDATNPDANEAASTDPTLATNGNESVLDNLLKGISDDTVGDDLSANEDNTTAHTLCENELYQLLLGNDFKMKVHDKISKVYNCPLSWWKSSAHRFVNLGKLAVKYLGVPATSAPSERIWSRAARVLTVKRNRMSEEVTAAMMYCRENKHILHKYYTEIAKEMMNEGDHHLIVRHKALLPTFADENDEDSEANIDVGV
jgi:hAT family C-terminal dimerisation region